MKNLVISLFIALALGGSGFAYRAWKAQASQKLATPKGPIQLEQATVPVVGEAESDHVHATLFIIVDNQRVDFFDKKYMEANPLVHFENDDGSVVHAHATGVTLSYFLSTLNVSFSGTCLRLDTGEQYCTDGSKKLRIIVAGQEVHDPSRYVMREGDKILVAYGDDDMVGLRLKVNSIPDLPKDF